MRNSHGIGRDARIKMNNRTTTTNGTNITTYTIICDNQKKCHNCEEFLGEDYCEYNNGILKCYPCAYQDYKIEQDARQKSKCRDCNGTGLYLGLNNISPCRSCK